MQEWEVQGSALPASLCPPAGVSVLLVLFKRLASERERYKINLGSLAKSNGVAIAPSLAPGSSLSVKVRARGECHPGNPGALKYPKSMQGWSWGQWESGELQEVGCSTRFPRVLQPQSILMVTSRALSTFEKLLLNFNLTFPKFFPMSLFCLALSINTPRNIFEMLLSWKGNGVSPHAGSWH